MKIYKLEKGIKMPAPVVGKSDGRAGRVASTLAVMEVGDSFLVRDALEAVKAEKGARDKNRRQMMTGGGQRFASRRVKGGVRIWRVK